MEKNLHPLDRIARLFFTAVVATLYFMKIIGGTTALILGVAALILAITAVVNVAQFIMD